MRTETSDIVQDVERSAAGDPDAFGRLVARHKSLVCSIAYAITGDVALSEDIAQDVFLSAWQRLSSLREPSRVTAWLAAITRNRARTELQRRGHSTIAITDIAGTETAVGPDPEQSATREEREQVTWQALARMPELYREPLVLFYREGQSVRNVATLLEISEGCAKQRLSRGREMLKQRVAALVEKTLADSGPGNAFTFLVLAALPTVSAPLSLVGATVTAASVGKVAGAKGLWATAAGTLAGLAGFVIGMTGGFFGVWAGIRNSGTLRQRRHSLKFSIQMYALVWAFLGYEGLSFFLFCRNIKVMLGFALVGGLVYLPLLAVFIAKTVRRASLLATHDEEFAVEPIEESDLSLKCVWRNFKWGLAVAVVGSAGTVLHSLPRAGDRLIMGTFPQRNPWLALVKTLPGVGGVLATIATIVFIVLCHVAFVVLFWKGVAIAANEEIFQETAPRFSHGRMPQPSTPEREQHQWRHVLIGYVVSLLGSSAWLAIAMAVDGHFGWSIGSAAAIIAVVATGTGTLRRGPHKIGVVIFASMTAIGIVMALALFFAPLRMLTVFPGMLWHILPSGICFALYFVIGLAQFISMREGEKGKR